VLLYSLDGRCQATYSAYEMALGVKSVSWSSTSQFLAVGSYDEKVRYLHTTGSFPVSNVHPCIRAYVCPSTESLFFDFSEISLVGRGRQVMYDGMQYDPIQGQGQGLEPFKVGNPAVFKSYLFHHLQWELATDHGFLN